MLTRAIYGWRAKRHATSPQSFPFQGKKDASASSQGYSKNLPRSSVTPNLFALSLAQLVLGRINFALRLLAKKNPAELVTLVISGGEFFLRVRSIKIHAGRRQREVAHEIHPQIEHLRPKIGDLFVTNAFLAGHISPCNQTLL